MARGGWGWFGKTDRRGKKLQKIAEIMFYRRPPPPPPKICFKKNFAPSCIFTCVVFMFQITEENTSLQQSMAKVTTTQDEQSASKEALEIQMQTLQVFIHETD